MLKILFSFTMIFFFVSGQAQALSVKIEPESKNASENDMKTCYGRLNELGRFDHAKYKLYNKRLMSTVQSQAALNTSGKFASQETMNYIKSQQTKAIRNTCNQISQKLDENMVKKAMTSLSN